MSIKRAHIRLSLAAKFNLLTIALIIATSTAICLFMIRLEMKSYYNDLLNHGKIIADTTAKNCEFGIYTENEALLLPVLETLSADSEIAYVTVLNRRHRMLASRAFKGINKPPEDKLPIREESLEVAYGEVIDKQSGLKYIEILCPLVSGGHINTLGVLSAEDAAAHQPMIIGHVRLGLLQKGLQQRIRQLILSATLITSLIVLLGTGLTILLSRRITAPLKQLMKATQDISEGKFDTSFKIRTSDELGDLAWSLDHMRERLYAYHMQAEERIAVEQRHLLEKEKLMMDLHDGIGGITTNIGMLSELAQKANDMEDVKKTLATISQLSLEGVAEIRSFMQSLDSKELSWQALAAEIRKQGATLVEPHHIKFSADTSVEDNVPEKPGSLIWVNVFRIYKEILLNVIKHSQAGSVAVALSVSHRGLRLCVKDDGIGYGKDISTGRGLPNMKKRAHEIGGHVTKSPAERGTLTCLEIPFPVHYSLPAEDI